MIAADESEGEAVTATTGSADSPGSTFCPAEARIYVLVAAILASAMGFIDGSVVSIATPAIRSALGASLGEVQWVSNGYMLFLGSLLLLGGAAGDRFGLRRVFAAGIGLFVIASLASALAPDANFLITARAVQGIGAAFMVPSSLAIIAKAYPRAERGRAIGIWAAASSLTTILGPVIGGLVLTVFGEIGWRLVFAVNLPLGAVALALLFFKVPDDRPEGGRRLDWPGAALVTPALGLIAYGLTASGGTGAPPAGHVMLYCGIGLVLFIAFLVWEARARQPMMPLQLFANIGFSGANALTFTLYFSLSAIGFYLPMTMIAGWGETPAIAAIASLPLGIALTLLSSLAGRLADRFGAAPPIAGGAVLVGLGFAGLGLTAPLHNVWFAVIPLMTVMGVGMGFVVSPLSTAVMTALSDADSGLASGINNAVARVAGLIAVALMGSVAAFVFQSALGEAAGQDLSFGLPASGLPSATEALRQAATDRAFAALAFATAGLALVSALIAWLTLEKRFGSRG
jgi:EmrB/QacA subfamily drug resistance transporter